MFDVYAITPEIDAGVIAERVRDMLEAAPAGRVALQLRAKHLSLPELRALGVELRALSRARDVRLLVNGDVELATEIGADGVQLPENGMAVAEARARLGARALIGASRHDLRGLVEAAATGASFVLLSPVFAVPGKGEPLGLSGFAAIARESSVPVFALGGIGVTHAAELVRRGAHGVAAIRELFDAPEPASALSRLLSAVEQGRRACAPA